MSIIEFNYFHKKQCSSIFISKFNYNMSFILNVVDFNINFVIKKQTKNKFMYLFIVILLLFNNKPVLIQTKKKKNGKKKLLGFKIYLTIFEIYSIILIYFPILDLITKVENKLNGLYTNIIFDSFPLIYEVEKLCELNTLYIDYIYDYKMV